MRKKQAGIKRWIFNTMHGDEVNLDSEDYEIFYEITQSWDVWNEEKDDFDTITETDKDFCHIRRDAHTVIVSVTNGEGGRIEKTWKEPKNKWNPNLVWE